MKSEKRSDDLSSLTYLLVNVALTLIGLGRHLSLDVLKAPVRHRLHLQEHLLVLLGEQGGLLVSGAVDVLLHEMHYDPLEQGVVVLRQAVAAQELDHGELDDGVEVIEDVASELKYYFWVRKLESCTTTLVTPASSYLFTPSSV